MVPEHSKTVESPVSVFKLAQILDLPRRWLKQEADAGRIPCLRIGKRVRLFDVAAVRQALALRAAKGEVCDVA